MLLAAVHQSANGTSLHSRQCNILSAFGRGCVKTALADADAEIDSRKTGTPFMKLAGAGFDVVFCCRR